MDDRLHEFGDAPGYEFDAPRGPWPPRPGHRAVLRRGRRAAPAAVAARPWAEPLDPPARSRPPGRRLLARDTLAAMRARNWLTSLALPLVAAIAVGVAVRGRARGEQGRRRRRTVRARGRLPARPAGGGRLRRRRQSGRGGRDRGGAARPRSPWAARAAAARCGSRLTAAPAGAAPPCRRPAAGQGNAGQLAGVAHGASGWLAVGAAAAGPAAALRPAVIGSADGRTWTVAGDRGRLRGPGPDRHGRRSRPARAGT